MGLMKKGLMKKGSYKMEKLEQILDKDSFEGIYLVSSCAPDKLGEGFHNRFDYFGDLKIFPRGLTGDIRYIKCD